MPSASPPPLRSPSAQIVGCGAGSAAGDTGPVVRDAALGVSEQGGTNGTYFETSACLRIIGSPADRSFQGSVYAMVFDRDGHLLQVGGQELHPFPARLQLAGDAPLALPDAADAIVQLGVGMAMHYTIDHTRIVPQILYQLVLNTCDQAGANCGAAATTWWLVNACVTDTDKPLQPLGTCQDAKPTPALPAARRPPASALKQRP